MIEVDREEAVEIDETTKLERLLMRHRYDLMTNGVLSKGSIKFRSDYTFKLISSDDTKVFEKKMDSLEKAERKPLLQIYQNHYNIESSVKWDKLKEVALENEELRDKLIKHNLFRDIHYQIKHQSYNEKFQGTWEVVDYKTLTLQLDYNTDEEKQEREYQFEFTDEFGCSA